MTEVTAELVQNCFTSNWWRWLSVTLVAMFTLAAPSGAMAGANEKPASEAANPSIPKGKQTTLGLYVTAKEAYERWKADPEKVKILDVRTPEEFLFVGFPTMCLENSRCCSEL